MVANCFKFYLKFNLISPEERFKINQVAYILLKLVRYKQIKCNVFNDKAGLV